MTKTQTTIRVSPDTLAAIDAAAERTGTTRARIIDRWLGEQAATNSAHAQPIEQQAWYRAGELAAMANDRTEIARTLMQPDDMWQNNIVAALMDVIAAINVLAGTAPDDAR